MERTVWNSKCIISPSLICLDMLHLEDQIRELEANGIQMLHIDILDGHFSPSMPLGFEAVKQLRKITDLVFECHVMTDCPEYFINELLKIGVEQITFQIETASHIDELINYIHSRNVRVGVALKPATSLRVLDYIIEKCDEVLLMQINPGFASGKNEEKVLYADRKIREARELIDKSELKTKLAIDGRVSIEQIQKYGEKIVDIFICGTTCINRHDITKSLLNLTDLRERILERK